jgi:hypothetical protein
MKKLPDMAKSDKINDLTDKNFQHQVKDNITNYKWLYAGTGLTVLNSIVVLSSVANLPIGASTAYPYLADLITGTTKDNYFTKIKEPGHWEVLLLTGAFVSGLVLSIVRKEFKFTIIQSNWKNTKVILYRNDSFGHLQADLFLFQEQEWLVVAQVAISFRVECSSH